MRMRKARPVSFSAGSWLGRRGRHARGAIVVVCLVGLTLASCSSTARKSAVPATAANSTPVAKPPLVPHPCSLVTTAEAQAALGGQLDQPVEAPQGPTCIFKLTSGTIAATIAVENAPLARFIDRMKGSKSLVIAKHLTYCGILGSPTLVSEVGANSLLVVSAPCSVAQKLAADALPHLDSSD